MTRDLYRLLSLFTLMASSIVFAWKGPAPATYIAVLAVWLASIRYDD